MKQNINNEKTAINFIWEINYAKWGALEKIIDIHESRKQGIEKTLKPQDIIPNYGSDPKSWQGNRFFLQTIASWAAKHPENPVRLVVNSSNFFSLNELKKLDKKENKKDSKSFSEEKDLIKYIQKKYKTDITLEEVQNEYKKTFIKLEKDIKTLNKNFEIKEFSKLVEEYVSGDEMKENQSLKKFLSNEIPNPADKIDLFKIFISYYGFGYEKNLVIDMDITPKIIKDFERIKNQKKDIFFGSCGGIENQLCSTVTSKIMIFKIIFKKYYEELSVGRYSSEAIFHLIQKEYQKQINLKEYGISFLRECGISDDMSKKEQDDYLNEIIIPIDLAENRRFVCDSSWKAENNSEKIINESLYLGKDIESYWPMDGYESTLINKKIHDQVTNKDLSSIETVEAPKTSVLKNIEQIETQDKTFYVR